MFCYQCEQTARGTGCTISGVCGKDQPTADLQDLLLFAAKGISMYAYRARQNGVRDRDLDRFILEALFTTVTNVNFDAGDIASMVHEAGKWLDHAKELYLGSCRIAGELPENIEGPCLWRPAANMEGMLNQAEETGILKKREKLGDVLTGLEYLCLYGLKGMAAYADHALILDYVDEEILGFFHMALDFLSSEHNADELTSMALKIGEMNVKTMGLLDEANTTTFGSPVPTKVRITPLKGKAILVSGHDLLDLDNLLKQTEGKGINVYTHGEMLPAHGYPKLKKYDHLAGNYGGAWQNQRQEFESFPGAILMTTNCIQKPKESYLGRIFTTGLVEWPGAVHLKNGDFQPVIEAALESPGFEKDGEEKFITVGFAARSAGSVEGKIVNLVKAGKIRHFFLIGGCDGAKQGRDYYTRLAEAVPKDCVILTLACGKYRFNKIDFGEIEGIPRLLDVGQCNDAYSAVRIASSLARAFGTEINNLPLSIVLSWYEQKAIAVLLSLLSLGIKNIRIGPSLPAFITPPVLDELVTKFNLIPIGSPEDDLRKMLS